MPSAVKGDERETFVSEFLKQLFPPPYRFGAGAITDSTGACSGQLDVVVEYPFLPSFPMPGGTQRLYLAESVALVIEVKSNLTSQWSQIESSVAKLKPLRRKWTGSTALIGGSIMFGQPSDSPVPYIAVGYTGYRDPESLKAKLDATPEDRRPDGALVIDSGAFVGPCCAAGGPLGLFGFLFDLTMLIRQVTSAEADLSTYVATATAENEN